MNSSKEVLYEHIAVNKPTRLLLFVVFGVLIILLVLRGRNGKFNHKKLGHYPIEGAPFRVPFVGHVWAFIWDPDRFLRYCRERAIHGIFNLKMFGVDTCIIHSPSLMKSFFALPGSVIEHKTMGSNIITKIFDFPSAEVPQMITHFDQLMNTFVTQLTKGPGFDRSWIKLLTDIEEIVPSIVTPSSGHKGLRSWERTANIKVQPNGTIEADLFPLIRNCVGSLSSKEMMGHVFVDSHPDFLEDIWQVDANIMGFVFGMPSWLPSIAKARKSRTRILEKLVAWHTEMEAVGPLTDSDADCAPFGDVSDLMKQRQKIWSERGFSMKARAAVDLSILWAINDTSPKRSNEGGENRLNANSNSTVYWMLRNIYATPGLLEDVRREIAPACLTTNNKVQIDWKRLLNNSPLFKSCYFETLRIDSASWSFKRLQKDCILQEAGEDARPPIAKGKPTTFHMKKGDAVLVPSDLHHTDGRYFPNPSEFRPERFFVNADDGHVQSEIKSIRPYGGGATMCKGRFLAEREVLAFVAAMLNCWDLEPVKGSSWDMDSRVKTSGVSSPKDNLRVNLKRRVA
ncbi:Cytochrome P450 [Penicillium verrucosum]|uniref:Cytochrome P450 n=1 Tax=Penicillium verrucosum TaxID=60171 RepID=UPI002545AEED|nr:Cytochrome P450 [Penicillium verrucosum]KAJ5940490.1 Cytochrome P450 [Penicillium verrucosum]